MPSWCRWFLSAALQILPSRLGSRVSIFSNEWLTSPWRNLLLSLGSLNLRKFSQRRSSDPALWIAFTPQSSSSWRSFNHETGLILDQMIFPGSTYISISQLVLVWHCWLFLYDLFRLKNPEEPFQHYNWDSFTPVILEWYLVEGEKNPGTLCPIYLWKAIWYKCTDLSWFIIL